MTSRRVLIRQLDQRVKAVEENNGRDSVTLKDSKLNGKGISVPVRGRYKHLELRVHVTQVLYDRRWQLNVGKHFVDELVAN